MSTVIELALLPGRILSWVHIRVPMGNFSPVTEMRKGAKILGASYVIYSVCHLEVGLNTPQYKLYRCVRPQRVWFLCHFGPKWAIDFNDFGLKDYEWVLGELSQAPPPHPHQKFL